MPAPRPVGDPAGPPPTVRCDLVLPCRDEAAALVHLLPRIPPAFSPIVVDNGSQDGTAEVASRLGARVIREPTAGYGAAVHAGVLASTSEHVAVMDADGSFDPRDLVPLLAEVTAGRADLALGRRRPVARGVWPWHARAGGALVLWWLRRRTGLPIRDIAPLRVCRRDDLLVLGVRDRRSGYPLELLQRAHAAGWRIIEIDVAYHPRAVGTRSKVAGSVAGSLRAARDFAKVLL